MGIIAPFWAVTDTYLPFKYNHSKVYYQVYSQTQNESSEILDLATRHVQDYIEGFGDFRANWVLVVTWEKLCPYSYYSYYYYSNEQNFQLNCPRVSIIIIEFNLIVRERDIVLGQINSSSFREAGLIQE